MKNKKEISDEALARYISGLSSADEETRVLDFMAESDENVGDLMNIADAVRIQQEAEKQAGTKTEGTHRFALRPIYWRYGIGGSEPVIVASADSTKTEIITDSTRLDATSPSDDGLLAENKGGAKKPASGDGMYDIHQDQNAMASQGSKAEALSLEVVTPRRSHEVCLRGDKLSFSWHSNGAKTELILLDDEMELLRRIDVTGRESIDINTTSLSNVDTLHWRIEARSANGTVVNHEGAITLFEKGRI